jgi:hypothetical protein
MKAGLSICVFLGVLAASSLGAAAASPAEDIAGPVAVTVASGRVFTGQLDPRTDDSRLWLRWTHGTITLLRPIDWARVVEVQSDGNTVPAADFRRAVASPQGVSPPEIAADAAELEAFRFHSWPSADSQPAGASNRPEASPVRSLAIDAWAANWDGDVEVDGVVVEVRPLDAGGAVVPVHGTLEVDLIGWRTGRTRPNQPPVRLGRWTRSVQVGEIGPSGVAYKLPFQGIHPEFDLRWSPLASVHARLSVPGEGTFDATASTVRIRPYSALRDHLEQTTGRRFYAVERTGRGN